MASLLPFAMLFTLLIFTSLAFSNASLSPTLIATSQTKFWSDNVANTMPSTISSKLSPLTKFQTVSYATASSSPNFHADTKFCSLANLACTTSIDASGLRSQQAKVYNKHDDVLDSIPDALVYNKYGGTSDSVPNENIDPFTFFRISLLKEGNTVHLSNLKVSLPHRAFLPPQIADKISLTTQGITNVFPTSSPQAIRRSLLYCDAAAIKGERKVCAKSLEEMIGFGKTALDRQKLVVLTSESTKGSSSLVAIKKIRELDATTGIVACHEMLLPFATYFCHTLPSSKIYSVELVEPKTQGHVNTVVAICHMDTSAWPANHVSFKILKFGPGQGEACHWLNQIDVAWIGAGN